MAYFICNGLKFATYESQAISLLQPSFTTYVAKLCLSKNARSFTS